MLMPQLNSAVPRPAGFGNCVCGQALLKLAMPDRDERRFELGDAALAIDLERELQAAAHPAHRPARLRDALVEVALARIHGLMHVVFVQRALQALDLDEGVGVWRRRPPGPAHHRACRRTGYTVGQWVGTAWGRAPAHVDVVRA
jgi:hypothetical protein